MCNARLTHTHSPVILCYIFDMLPHYANFYCFLSVQRKIHTHTNTHTTVCMRNLIPTIFNWTHASSSFQITFTFMTRRIFTYSCCHHNCLHPLCISLSFSLCVWLCLCAVWLPLDCWNCNNLMASTHTHTLAYRNKSIKTGFVFKVFESPSPAICALPLCNSSLPHGFKCQIGFNQLIKRMLCHSAIHTKDMIDTFIADFL